MSRVASRLRQVFDPATGRQQAMTHDQLKQAVERGGQVFSVIDESTSTPIWDVVDGAWTKPLPNEMLPVELMKVVSVCSDCRYNSAYEGDVAKHIDAAQMDFWAHKKAQVESVDARAERCSACKLEFRSRMHKAWNHIARMTQSDHQRASVLTMRRYSLEPSAFPSGGVTAHGPQRNGHEGKPGGPLAERRLRQRRHNRRRSRKRGGHDHGS